MATNLFAMPGTVGGATGGGGQKPLVEFRAGKMNFDESSKKVTPDKRKGLIQLTQSVDGLIHFSWKDRTSGVVESDLIVFPDEAVFKHVKQCSTGRVYLLEYKTSSRKLFFWMQEPSDDKDEENASKINQYMNSPPSPGDNVGVGGAVGAGGGMDQSALFQMLSGGRGQRSAGGAAGQQAQQQGGNVLGVNDLQSILSGIGMPTSALSGMLGRQPPQTTNTPQRPTQGAPQQQAAAPPQGPRPRLSALINPELILPHLSNPAVQQQLIPFLPQEQRTPEELRQVLNSPQFQQSLDAFGDALETGQLGELMRQFGLNTTGPTSIQQFLQAIQNSTPQQPPNADKKDDNMDTK